MILNKKTLKINVSFTTTVCSVAILTWKSRFKNSLAKALFTLQIW